MVRMQPRPVLELKLTVALAGAPPSRRNMLAPVRHGEASRPTSWRRCRTRWTSSRSLLVHIDQSSVDICGSGRGRSVRDRMRICVSNLDAHCQSHASAYACYVPLWTLQMSYFAFSRVISV